MPDFFPKLPFLPIFPGRRPPPELPRGPKLLDYLRDLAAQPAPPDPEPVDVPNEPPPGIDFPGPDVVDVPNAPPPGPETPEPYPLEQLPGQLPPGVFTHDSHTRYGGPYYEQPDVLNPTHAVEKFILKEGARRGKPYYEACDEVVGHPAGDGDLEYCDSIVPVEEYDRLRAGRSPASRRPRGETGRASRTPRSAPEQIRLAALGPLAIVSPRPPAPPEQRPFPKLGGSSGQAFGIGKFIKRVLPKIKPKRRIPIPRRRPPAKPPTRRRPGAPIPRRPSEPVRKPSRDPMAPWPVIPVPNRPPPDKPPRPAPSPVPRAPQPSVPRTVPRPAQPSPQPGGPSFPGPLPVPRPSLPAPLPGPSQPGAPAPAPSRRAPRTQPLPRTSPLRRLLPLPIPLPQRSPRTSPLRRLLPSPQPSPQPLPQPAPAPRPAPEPNQPFPSPRLTQAQEGALPFASSQADACAQAARVRRERRRQQCTSTRRVLVKEHYRTVCERR